MTIPLFWIKLICLSKVERGSLSKPTINPPLNFQTDVLNLFYTSYQVTILIQIFIAFCEAIFIRSFNSDKNLFESSLGHSDLKITMKYCHDKSESKRQAVEIMSGIYLDSRQKVDTTSLQSVTIRPVSPERMLH